MKFCQIGNIDAWIDLYSSSVLHYLYYIYTILLVLLDYFLKKWLFYEVGLSSSLLKNIWGLDFKEVEIELPQLSVCADAICRRNSVLLKFELNFFLLSLSLGSFNFFSLEMFHGKGFLGLQTLYNIHFIENF